MAKLNATRLSSHSSRQGMGFKLQGDDAVYAVNVPGAPKTYDLKVFAQTINRVGVKLVSTKVSIEGVDEPVAVRYYDVAPNVVIEAVVDNAGRTGKEAADILGYDPAAPVKVSKTA
jgi:hypothetical protein